MKNFLCALGIFLLIVMLAVPPILHVVLPDKEEEKEEEKIVLKTLSCDSSKYLSRTSYENDIVKMILIKKVTGTSTNSNNTDTNNTEDNNIVEDNDLGIEELPDTEIEPEEKTELDTLFDELKEDSRVVKEEAEDGEIIKIDFTVSDNSGLNLGSLNKPINDQFKYYEDNGLVCSILE